MTKEPKGGNELGQYWDEHDRKADEALARELFYGRSKRHPKTKLMYSEYPHGAREREALEALNRLLMWLYRTAVRAASSPPQALETYNILALVALAAAPDNSLRDPPTGPTPRRLAFQFRKGEKRRNRGSDLQIALHVANQVFGENAKTEAAVESAMKTFGLSRKAIFQAQRRVRKALPGIFPTHAQKS